MSGFHQNVMFLKILKIWGNMKQLFGGTGAYFDKVHLMNYHCMFSEKLDLCRQLIISSRIQ